MRTYRSGGFAVLILSLLLVLTPDRAAVANAIQLENGKAGTTDWKLTNPATNREIEGYASLTSVNRGGQINLYVNTVASSYTIEVFRMGWYGSLGARRMTSAISRTGRQQSIPSPNATTGLVECNWTDPYILTIPNTADSTDWCSGVYLAKLTAASSGKQSYIMFVVRDDSRNAALLFQSSVNTFQAYNPWGGKSLYTWNSTGNAPATKVSYNRPYAISPYGPAAYSVGTGEFMTNVQPGPIVYGPSSAGWEYNMVRWLEREGYDVSYCTNVDTAANASLLLNRKGFLSVGHDEYWSWEMRTNVENARNAGVSLGFFSSNAVYWQVRFENSGTGAANRTMVCYKNSVDPYSTDGTSSNDHLITRKWRENTSKPPEDALIGVMYETDPVVGNIVVEDAASWVFAGTGLSDGDELPGLMGYEVDRIYANSPTGLKRLAHSPYANGTAYSDMTVYTATSGATVFATGSMAWSWGLDDYNAPALRAAISSPAAQQITRNVLSSFLGNRPSGATRPGLASIYADNFNDNNRDTTAWDIGTIQGALYSGPSAWDSSMAVLERNQRLEITTRSGVSGERYSGYVSKTGRDLTGAAVSVELVQAASVGRADTQLALCNDSQNFLIFIIEGGILYTDAVTNGSRTTSGGIPYDPAAHRFLRLRHVTANDRILFETSPDNANWTLLRSMPRPLSLASMKIELSAGTYRSESSTSTAIFDNFRIDRPSAGNAAPVARPGGPYAGSPGVAVSFSGTTSSDADGTITNYAWNFGDGTVGGGATIGHAYTAAGIYTVTLTVTDNAGASASASTTATISASTGGGDLFSDNFNDNSRDPAKWTIGTIQGQIYSGASAWDPVIPVLEQNQRLEITPRTNVAGDHYNGFVTTSSLNLTGATVSVEAVQTAAGGNTDSSFALCLNSQNFLMILKEGSMLYFDQAVNGARTTPGIPYDAVQHRYWRIRHDAATDTIYFETSPNGSSWTVRRSTARVLSLSAMKIELSAGTYRAESVTGTTIFDNLTATAPGVNPPANVAPTSRPGGPYTGTTNTAVQFNGTASSDSDGTIVAYSWSFGDGTTASGSTSSHAYTAAGTYTVFLTVTDNAGATHQASTTAVISAPPTGGGTLLSDDFDDNSRDSSKWTFGSINAQLYAGPSGWNPSIPVLEKGKRVEVSPIKKLSGANYNGYVTTSTWNLTNASAAIEVVSVAGGGKTDTYLALTVDPQNFYMIFEEDGLLYFDETVNSARSNPTISYSSGTHRFWRIRHLASSDSILFETSSDGQTWVTRRTIQRRLPIGAMKIGFGAGTYQSEGSTGTAKFDNFTLIAAATGSGASGGPNWTSSLDPDGDADGDGLSNAQEAAAGTDPLDSASGLKVSSASFANGEMAIIFPSVAGRQYQLECNTSLNPDTWGDVGAPIDGTGAEMEIAIPMPSALDQCFFRLRLIAP